MKKLVLLALTLGAVAWTGCQKKESGAGGGAAKKVTLTVWESANGPDEFIRQAGEAFTRQNPDIVIKFVNVELMMNAAAANIWNGADVQTELDACNAVIISN